MYNVGGQIGGDSDLSPRGWKYAEALPALIKENVGEDANLEVSCIGPFLAGPKADKPGLDIDSAAYIADWFILEFPEKDLEVSR
jgi:hypothetical protein